ncbi:MAG: tetratricopeptide repeat protein [Chitinophagales bacterium]
MIINAKRYLLFLLCFSAIYISACSTEKNTRTTDDSSITVPSTRSRKGNDTVQLERVYIDGCKYLALGDYDKAVHAFEDVLRIDPHNAAANYQLGSIYYNFGNFNDALGFLEQAVQYDYTNTYYLELYAKVLMFGAKYSDAINILNDLLKLDPDNYETYYRLGDCYEKMGKMNDALHVYENMEKQSGDVESAAFELQRLYARMEDYGNAVKQVERLLAIDATNPKYLRLLTEYYEQAGRPDDAGDIFEALLKADPDNVDLQFKKASLLQKQGDTEGYYRTMREAFGNSKGNIDLKIFYLVIFIDSIDHPMFTRKDSILEWTRLLVLAHPEDAKAYAMRGDFLYYSGDRTQARTNYAQSLQLRSDVYDVWIKMFYIDAALMQYDSLQQVSDDAIDLFPNQPLSYYYNGVAKNSLDKHDAAITVLKRALPLTPTNEKLRADIYGELGEAYYYTGQYALSDEAFDNSLQLVPDNPYTLNNYAYFLSERNTDLDKAGKMILSAIKLEPENAYLEDTYGWILYQQERFADAEKWLHAALQHGGAKSGVILEHYGDVLFRLKRPDEALEYWKKAKATGKASNLIEDKINNGSLHE